MFNLFRKKAANYFSTEEKDKIVDAIKTAELSTSGEVRVYIENKCSYVNALDRAKEVFQQLHMQHTEQRNAVLVYVALKDRQLAVFGDEGIHQKVGDAFWNEAVKNMLQHFNKQNYAEGIAEIILKTGKALQLHFPYDAATDVNELPDDIVFGK
jgi:uncharacterized membrane protein